MGFPCRIVAQADSKDQDIRSHLAADSQSRGATSDGNHLLVVESIGAVASGR